MKYNKNDAELFMASSIDYRLGDMFSDRNSGEDDLIVDIRRYIDYTQNSEIIEMCIEVENDLGNSEKAEAIKKYGESILNDKDSVKSLARETASMIKYGSHGEL